MIKNPHIFKTYNEMSQHVAETIVTEMQNRDHFTLGLATGSSPNGTYKKLITKLKDANLTRLHTINLDEWYPIEQSRPESFYYEMMKQFWRPLYEANNSFRFENAHILNGEAADADAEAQHYEKLIHNLGGIDFQVLGLGVNGHIAFNEPGSEGDSRTRKIELDETTRTAHKDYFTDISFVPTYGLTMGIGTILDAKKIALIVTGESKRPIFKKLLNLNEPTSSIPASFLMDHNDVTVYTDIFI